MHRRSVARPRRRTVLRAVGTLLLGALAACGSGSGSASVAEDRADQVRAAARAAGLPAEVADLLAVAARGPLATFQVTYAGADGASLVVSQDRGRRRVDVVQGATIVESRILRDGVAYRCTPEAPEGAGGALPCQRAAGSLEAMGAFTETALDTFTADLARTADTLDLFVESRTIAGTAVACLVSTPTAGTPLDGVADPATDTLCVSAEGAQLLIDADGERLVADAYSTEVPEGTFDL